jgi:hypothetical protein
VYFWDEESASASLLRLPARLVRAALKMLDDGASYDDVRERYGVPASTLRQYRAALRANTV